MIVTRFAPSPTGSFHMGSLRTAIYNYLFAKKNNGNFILRIEDTDKERSKSEYEEEILNIFKKFNLKYDQISYQSHNREMHINYLDTLIKNGSAYKDEDGPYRFKVDKSIDHFEYNDLILGNIKIPSENIEDFSIARSNKNPTFILTNLIDDHKEGITNVIRGNDHSINTIKQNLISKALNFNKIEYAHIPLIHDMSGKKLSKRDNVTNVDDYLKNGYLVDSIFNFIVKLGNNFNDIEFLDLDIALQNFDIDKIVSSPAKFDIEKLNFINQYYLKKLDLDQFKMQISDLNKSLIENYNIELVYKEILDRCVTLNDINFEIVKLIKFYDSKEVLKIDEEEQNLIKNIYEVIQNLHNTDDVIKILEENRLNLKKIGKTIRKILVNFESKLPIDKIILFYGIGNFKERLLLYLND